MMGNRREKRGTAIPILVISVPSPQQAKMVAQRPEGKRTYLTPLSLLLLGRLPYLEVRDGKA